MFISPILKLRYCPAIAAGRIWRQNRRNCFFVRQKAALPMAAVRCTGCLSAFFPRSRSTTWTPKQLCRTVQCTAVQLFCCQTVLSEREAERRRRSPTEKSLSFFSVKAVASTEKNSMIYYLLDYNIFPLVFQGTIANFIWTRHSYPAPAFFEASKFCHCSAQVYGVPFCIIPFSCEKINSFRRGVCFAKWFAEMRCFFGTALWKSFVSRILKNDLYS